MRRFFSFTIILPIVLGIYVTSLTTYVMLDAFVIEREISDTPISRVPSTEEDNAGNDPETTYDGDTEAPDDTNGPATTDEPDDSDSPHVTDAPDDTDGTDAPGDTGEAPGTDRPQTEEPEQTTQEPEQPDYPIVEDMYYKDENIEISIEETEYINENGVPTTVFIVDLKLSDIEYLMTAFAKGRFGNNIEEKTSEIAKANDAIFAINGDFYGFRDEGFVLRNYELWRASARHDGIDDALVIDNKGNMYSVDERKYDALTFPYSIYQVFSFGPTLIEDGNVVVEYSDEVGQSASSNPRTAIGMIEPLHYKIVVSEGRLVDDDGLTLYELAEIMKDEGCVYAYNLDGGSSTTLYFNGRVINELYKEEREVSDIIFINGSKYSG